MRFNEKQTAFVAVILAATIWGATAAIMKYTLQTVPPFTLAFIRFGVATLLLYPFVRKHTQITHHDAPMVALAGLSGIAFHIAFFFWGLKLTTALNAGIIIASTPLFTLLFAHIFLREKLKKNLVVAAILGLLGIGIIIAKDIAQQGLSLSPLGDLFVLIAILLFVVYEILSKKLFQTYPPSVITFYAFVVGVVFFAPLAFLESVQDSTWVSRVNGPAVAGILYGIFFSSFAAYSLWEWGLSKISASRVGFFFYLDPIVSTIAAVLLLSEVITVPFVLGAILIFLGIFLAEGRLPYHHLHAKGPYGSSSTTPSS